MRELKARFGEVESSPYEVTVYPGISSVSALAARFGISWDDACLASAHGRDCDAAALLKEHEKVFLLLDSSMNLRQICRILKDADMGNTRIYAGVRMGYEDERKIYGTAEEMTDIETNSLTAVFLEREKDER
ncbi:MAG: cobalt-precorrin-7 (C(5))-methyltransferase [Lachnospiraceae bacterium]